MRNTYDGGGRLIRVETGELSAWQSEAVAPASWAGFTIFRHAETDYDVMDRKTVERAYSGSLASRTLMAVTQYSYDSFGRLQCSAVRMNSAAWASLPSDACTQGTAGTNGPDRISKNVYDAADQLL